MAFMFMCVLKRWKNNDERKQSGLNKLCSNKRRILEINN